MPIWLLVVGLGAMLTTITLVGGRELVLAYPHLGQWALRLIRPTPSVKHSQRRTRRVRKVESSALCRISRLLLHHQRRFDRTPNHRTTEPSPKGHPRTRSANDITEASGYRPLTAEQARHVAELFTLNRFLPPAHRISCNKLYPLFGGTRTRRMAELSAIKNEVDAKLQLDIDAEQEARLARMIGTVTPQPEIEVPAYEGPPVEETA